MAKQITDTLLMVRPDTFGFNEETAITNAFISSHDQSARQQRDALAEFAAMTQTLRGHGIRVVAIPSPSQIVAPDAVFPNNWISHEEGGEWIIYPMLAPSRRRERQWDAVQRAVASLVSTDHVLDLTALEKEGKILEGTGSLVLDRIHKVAFAVESPRTTTEALAVFSQRTGYRAVLFHAYGQDGSPVYHTNVLMGIGPGFAVVCLDAIPSPQEQQMVRRELADLGLEIIPITLTQLHAFCGNILGVRGDGGAVRILLSQTAYDAFTAKQKQRLASYGELVPVSIPTIERVGGGSARCMVAEVFI